MSASPDAPVVGADDIANYGTVTGTDKWWTGTSADSAVKGQTFVTGGSVMRLTAVSYQISSTQQAEPTKTYAIRVGTVEGSTFTEIHSETAVQEFTWNAGEFMTWTFDTPVILEPNTVYGFDVGLLGSTSVWQTGIPYINVTADDYTGGVRYTSGVSGTGTTELNLFINSDRVFHVAIERPLSENFELVATTPAAGATEVFASRDLELTFSQDVTPGTGGFLIRNLTNSTDVSVSANDPRVSYDQNVVTIDPSGLIEWNVTEYAIRIDEGAILGDGGTSFAGISDDTTWYFTTVASDPLLDVIAELKAHILDTAPLSAAEIEERKFAIDSMRTRFAENGTIIAALFDLIETYDTEIGPLWIARGEFSNRQTQPNDLAWTIYHVMQYIMDEVYNPVTLAEHESLLEGFKFASSSNFPGPCAPPADPTVSRSVLVLGSFETTFGRETQGWTAPARKPTGTYLAPGTIATVTVPPGIVGQGYSVRVGAHSWDLSTRRNQVRRLDRATIGYPINDTTVQVASPYGGGIYIEVPIGANAGVIEVTVNGAVRAPYFSAKSFHTTTPAEWDEVERHHPAPWADFQSEKFMMQVPTQWVHAHPNPTQLMADWDAAMDAQNDLMGFPRDRGKETMYCQVDLIMRSTVHAPGYPAINVTDNPNNERGGYHNNYLVRGPGVNAGAAWIEIHEQGHAYRFPKFGGETEAAVNLPHVAVMQQAFDFSWDEAFRGSLGMTNNPHRTLDNTAVAWMTSFNFSPRNNPMHSAEKSYQLKGHAKFVEIARLFGWDKLGDFWRSFMEDDANGVSYSNSNDDKILRLSRNVGWDMRPLLHFWGIHPQNPGALASAHVAEGIPASPAVRDLLLHYQSLVPADNITFRNWAFDWWQSVPRPDAFWTETEHARQWDTTDLFTSYNRTQMRADITTNEAYVEACAAQVREQVDFLIDLYFPDALGPDPMGFFIAPAAVNETTIAMEALAATAPVGPVEYYFENTSNGDFRDWAADPVWANGGLTMGQVYSYRVRARDGEGNLTGWSAESTALAEADVTPPSPDPMAFTTPPVAVSENTVVMTAVTATDVSGVEYFFECTEGGGPDSGWQDSTSFTAEDLFSGTQYTYRVRARDKSPNQNTTGWSGPATADTGAIEDIEPPDFVSLDPAPGSTVENLATAFTVVFSESVIAGSGLITLTNLTDGTQTLASVTNESLVTVEGNALTLWTGEELETGKEYAIRIDQGLVVDLAGNPFAGITDDLTWSFDTIFENPLADPGGPYRLDAEGYLTLDGSASQPSFGESITSYEWDLNNDGVFGDATGATPTAIPAVDLVGIRGMVFGENPVQLRVTDSAGKQTTATAIVDLIRAEATPGFDFHVDAGAAGDDDTHWADLVEGNPSGFGLLLDKPAVTRVAVGESVTSLSHAHEFPGGHIDNTGGALLVSSGTTTPRSFTNASGGSWATRDVSMEIWFRPDDINPASTNGQILFEDGGGTGLGFFVHNNEIQFRKTAGDGLVSYNLATDPGGILSGPATGDFIQVVGTFHVGDGSMRLFVNGRFIGSSTPGGNSWSGGDPAAFATRGGLNTGGIGAGQSGTESFAGRIALIRVYSDRILTEAEVGDNFMSLSPDDIAPRIVALQPENNATNLYPGIGSLEATFDEIVMPTGTGSITIRNLGDPSGASDVTLGLPDAAVSVSGRQVTVVLGGNLAHGTDFAIHISDDAIRDLAGNSFPGISDDVTWTFATAEENPNPPVIATKAPGAGAQNVSITTGITATFDQNLVIGTGDIVIKDLLDGTTTQTISVVDSTQVALDGDTLTITPSGLLEMGREYAVRISPGVVRNFSDIDFSGITNDTEWSFTTSNLGGQLGILDTSANGGINPATGQPWMVGDPYRLVFISSERLDPKVSPGDGAPAGDWNDIATWNAKAQGFADNATGHDLSGATWKVIGSTGGINARDNTATNPAVHGSGHPIMLIDGATIVAGDFNELWSGQIRNIINLTENAGQTIADAPSIPWPFTGTTPSGTAHGSGGRLRDISNGGNIRQGEANTTQGWIDRAGRSGQAAASTSGQTGIYAMSEPLFVVDLSVAMTTPYDDWAAANGLVGEDSDPASVLRADGLTNLQKFAFGMDPQVANFTPLGFVVQGELTVHGAPTLINFAQPGDSDEERAVFIRLKNHVEAGLLYTVNFSADLIQWTASNVPPTVLTDENSTSDFEVVSVPFPDTVPVDGGGDPGPARFMRVNVSWAGTDPPGGP